MQPPRNGAVLAMVLVCLLVVTLLGAALIQSVVLHHRHMNVTAERQQCLWLAESGVQRALRQLAHSPDYVGETWNVPAQVLGAAQPGAVTIRVTTVDEPRAGHRIQVEACFPDAPVRRTTVHREVYTLTPDGEH